MTNTNYPHNPNAEAELLGSMMIHPVKFEDIFAALSAEMFYDVPHQLIFTAIHDAFLKHGKVDLILAEQALVESDTLEKAGGMIRLGEIYSKANRFNNYMAHLALIRESYILRRIMLMSHTLCVKASSEQYESELLIEECNAQLNELMQLNVSDERVFTSRKVMDAVVTEYEERKVNVEKGKSNGLLTGITNLDKISNGLQNGDLTILAGRPSMGKTAVAIHMGMTMARSNRHVLIFSLEMTAVQLGNRMLLNESDIPVRHFKTGTLFSQQEITMRKTADQIASRSITIADIPGITCTMFQTAIIPVRSGKPKRCTIVQQGRTHGSRPYIKRLFFKQLVVEKHQI